MRSLSLPLVGVASLLLSAGCSVTTTGASCDDDSNCPTGQFCVSGFCSSTPSNASSSGATSSASSSTFSSSASSSSGRSSGSSSGTLSSGGSSSGASSSGGSSSSGNPCPPENRFGGNCTTRGATECDPADGGRILRCQATATVCNTWVGDKDCGPLLACDVQADAGPTCVCPAAGPIIYVDPILDPDGFDAGIPLAPTGANSPSICRFQTLTEALAAAPAHGTVQAELPPAWLGGQALDAGDLIRPTSGHGNGTYFVTPNGGLTGGTEPKWINDGGTFMDGSVVWRLGGSTAYLNETFPLVVDAGVTLESADCAVGPSYAYSCISGDFEIQIPPSVSFGANTAVELRRGATLSGFSIVDERGSGDSVECDEGPEEVTAQSLELISLGGDTGNGLRVDNGCTAVLGGILVAGYGTGVRFDGTSLNPSQLSFAELGVDTHTGSNVTLGNATGLAIESGVVELNTVVASGNRIGFEVSGGELTAYQSDVEYNTSHGIVVAGGSLVFLDGGIGYNSGDGVNVQGTLSLPDGGGGVQILRSIIGANANHGLNIAPNPNAFAGVVAGDCTITQNTESGIQLGGTSSSSVIVAIVAFDDVFSNGVNSTGDESGLKASQPANLLMTASAFHGNAGPQLDFAAPAPDGGAWQLGWVSCGDSAAGGPNAVYCYATLNVGVSVSGGATVDAPNMLWQNATPSSLSDDYSLSGVNVEGMYCGADPGASGC